MEKTEAKSVGKLNTDTYRAALQMMKWLPAVMALSYLANSAGIYGETMHAVVHYVGITITDEEMQEWRVMAKKVAREVIPNT